MMNTIGSYLNIYGSAVITALNKNYIYNKLKQKGFEMSLCVNIGNMMDSQCDDMNMEEYLVSNGLIDSAPKTYHRIRFPSDISLDYDKSIHQLLFRLKKLMSHADISNKVFHSHRYEFCVCHSSD